jgi:hypothetical protein
MAPDLRSNCVIFVAASADAARAATPRLPAAEAAFNGVNSAFVLNVEPSAVFGRNLDHGVVPPVASKGA